MHPYVGYPPHTNKRVPGSFAVLWFENRALEMGLKPRSSFKSWAFVALDPFEDLLLGPAFGAAKVRPRFCDFKTKVHLEARLVMLLSRYSDLQPPAKQ